jgi:hypothetical protein
MLPLEWKIYELSTKMYEDRDFFEINFGMPNPGTEELTHLEWTPQKPPSNEDSQITIEPK